MKRVSVVWIIFLALALSACGGGGGGGGGSPSPEEVNNPPVADAGPDQMVEVNGTVTLDGSKSMDPDNDSISFQWQQISGPQVVLDPTKPTQQFTANFPRNTILVFGLNVTDAKGETSKEDTCIISVQPLALDVLYAAYAGIGYLDAAKEEDDAHLYRVMLADLNSMVPIIFLDTLANDPDATTKLTRFLLLGEPQTFTYQCAGYTATLNISRGSIAPGQYWNREFTGSISVDFSPTGYYYGGNIYIGAQASPDLTVSISGYYKATLFEIQDILFKSIDIVARDSLSVTYPFGTVDYNQWHIAYTAYYGTQEPSYQPGDPVNPVNMALIPDLHKVPGGDFRDYTLDGAFSIDGNDYSFNNGFHFRQEQYDYVVNSVRITRLLVGIDGSLSVPGMTAAAQISTPFDKGDPVGSKTIYKVFQLTPGGIIDTGIWMSGKMSILDTLGTANVEFENGQAAFSGVLGSWLMDDWQDSLAPF
jgi:hypothetical protein